MDSNQYLDLIKARLSRNFDIEVDTEVLGENLPIFARMEIHNEKYFAVKKVKVWRAENYEYLFVKQLDEITEEDIKSFQEYLKNAVNHFVKPHSEHMSTIITGVIVVNSLPQTFEKGIKNFRYRKTYSLSLKGWSDVRLLVVDLHSNRVLSNKKGKEVVDFYLPEKKSKGKKGIFNFTK